MTIDLEACTYVVGVNSYSNGEVGAYEMSIRCPDVRLCRDCEVGSIACGEMVDGFLEDGDCALADGTLIDAYTFTLERTSNVSITLRSADFDTALNLSDNFCETFLNNAINQRGLFGAQEIVNIPLCVRAEAVDAARFDADNQVSMQELGQAAAEGAAAMVPGRAAGLAGPATPSPG